MRRRASALALTIGSTLAAVALPSLASAQNPSGNIDSAGCEGVEGWAQDGDVPDDPIDVHLYWLAPVGDMSAVASVTTADIYDDELCLVLGSCEHGFAVPIPMSLRDEVPHSVWAYGINDGEGTNPLLGSSPSEFTCPPPTIGEGVRRPLEGSAMTDWEFSAFFNQAQVSDAVIAGLPEVDPLNGPPLLVRAGNGDPTVWLIDRGHKRSISDTAAKNWKFDLLGAAVWNEAQLDVVPQGTAVPDEPLLLKGTQDQVYLFDDLQCVGPDMDLPGCEMGGMEGGTGEETGDTTGDTEGGVDSGDTTGDGMTDTGSGETEGESTGSPSESTGGMDVPSNAQDTGGCGCGLPPRSPWAALTSLVLLGLIRRRNHRV